MEQDQGMHYDYVVGADKKLTDVIKEGDITPLLGRVVSAGALSASLTDESGGTLFSSGECTDPSDGDIRRPLSLEGETAGYLVVRGRQDQVRLLESMTDILFDALQIIMRSNFKTILATETHKTVVSQSYDELLDTNEKLKRSETRYRILAENLELEVQERTRELKKAHAKLLQQEKIASVGHLAAGIAHEINNPLGFISSNINTLSQYLSKLREILLSYRSLINRGTLDRADVEKAQSLWKQSKTDFIFSDSEDLIAETVEGATRVKKIVADLKGFSHIDEALGADADINGEIDKTLNVLTHEIPGDAEIIKEYGDLPRFSCNPAHLCQAFFNIILNAFQTGKERLRLTIKTRHDGDAIRTVIEDNGPGMPEDVRKHIFDPFFSTRDVGKGSGMGLNVAYEAITSCNGTIEVESEEGRGTAFTIVLPVAQGADNG